MIHGRLLIVTAACACLGGCPGDGPRTGGGEDLPLAGDASGEISAPLDGASGGDPGDGVDASSPASFAVGPDGGVFDLPAGGTLSIPAGALPAETTLTATSLAPPASELFDAVGPFYVFAPAGTVFAVPAVLTLPTGTPPRAGDRHGIAWRAAGGDWGALPTWQEAPLLIAAEIRHFSEGGAASWADLPGACCDGAACSQATAADCIGSFIGPAVPCTMGDLGTCAFMVCCDLGGTETLILTTEGACAADGGEEVAAAQCEVGCCVTGGDLQVWTRGRCDASDDGEFLDDEALCGEVCCATGEDPAASLVTSGFECAVDGGVLHPVAACEEVCCRRGQAFVVLPAFACDPDQGDEVVEDGALCDGVCCITGSDAAITSAGECQLFGGEELPAGSCDDVCCLVNLETYVLMPDVHCTAGWIGLPLPPGDCDPVCCVTDLGSPPTTLFEPKAAGACAAGGGAAAADPGPCDALCCSLDGEIFPELQGNCAGAGGGAVDAAACDQICCHAPGTDNWFPANATTCAATGGEEADAAACEEVCCQADGSAYPAPAAHCDAAGGVATDAALCETVCCTIQGEAHLVTVADCEGMEGWQVRPAEDCGVVCCTLLEGEDLEPLGSELMVKALCMDPPSPQWFEIGDPPLCEEICCALPGGAPQPDTQGSCLAAGGSVADGSLCEQVCCFEAGAWYEITLGECQAYAGEVVDDGVCAEICCEVTLEHYEVMQSGSCTEGAAGIPLPPELCEPACCSFESSSPPVFELVTMSIAACVFNEGMVLPEPSACDPVCCALDGAYTIRPEGECETLPDASVVDGAYCEKICCHQPGTLAWSLFDETYCAATGGQPVDAASCAEVCCEGDGDVIPAPQAWCAATGGVEVDGELCKAVCCTTPGDAEIDTASGCGAKEDWEDWPEDFCAPVCCAWAEDGMSATDFQFTPASVCLTPLPPYEGIHVSPELCLETCCLVGGLAFIATYGACNAMEGTSTDDGACAEICCAQDGLYLYMTPSMCADAGGAEAEDPAHCDTICCLQGGLPTLTTPEACDAAGGTPIPDANGCGAHGCDNPLPPATVGTGVTVGNLAALTDDSGAALPCPDAYVTDPGKTAGPDLVFHAEVPAGGCAMVKGTIVGWNPAVYVLDSCGVPDGGCYAFNYGDADAEPVVPALYPYPAPDEVRKAATVFCNPGPDPVTVALWMDAGTEQQTPEYKAPLEAASDFRVDWRVAAGAPANDGPAGATPLVPGEGAPLESLALATDGYSAAGVPGLTEGAGAGTPDLFYAFTPDQPGTWIFVVELLNPVLATLDDAGHFLALLGPGDVPVQGRAGGRVLRVKAPLGAGAPCTLVFDGGALAPQTLLDLSVSLYDGPANDDCGAAAVVGALPFEVEGTTVGAYDDYHGAGQNCADLMGADPGLGTPDVVYEYTPPSDGAVHVSLTSLTPGFQPTLLVSTACGAPGPLECHDGLETGGTATASFTFKVTAGTTYRFVVDGEGPWADVPAGGFLFALAAGTVTDPDDCTAAQVLDVLPVEIARNGRNLTDAFSGQTSECADYQCCLVGEIYSVTTQCPGLAVEDWSQCEPVCCSVGVVTSEELRGNCVHYGGEEGCPQAALPVSCCQIFALPQIAYVRAEGCGMPLQGGVQGTPVEAQFCEPVCCEGHGYQKRGNCANFEAASHPFPAPGNPCSKSGLPVGVGTLDAVFQYTATEDGILQVGTIQDGGTPKRFYGFVDQCQEGALESCDTINPQDAQAALALEAGQTGTIVVDGWDAAHPFGTATFAFTWVPGLPQNDTCATATVVQALPFTTVTTHAGASNDLAQVTTPACPGMTYETNGPDLVFRFDPQGQPTDLIAGVLQSTAQTLVYALSACGPQPTEDQCLDGTGTVGSIKPHVLLPGTAAPVHLVVEAPAGEPWGTFTFAMLDAGSVPNDVCADAIEIPGIPYETIGHVVGAANDYAAPYLGCTHPNYSARGAGPDVVYRLEITQDIIDAWDGITWQYVGATYLLDAWLMKNGCGPCWDSLGLSETLDEGADYQLGDVFHLVLDSKQADSAGMFSFRLEGVE